MICDLGASCENFPRWHFDITIYFKMCFVYFIICLSRLQKKIVKPPNFSHLNLLPSALIPAQLSDFYLNPELKELVTWFPHYLLCLLPCFTSYSHRLWNLPNVQGLWLNLWPSTFLITVLPSNNRGNHFHIMCICNVMVDWSKVRYPTQGRQFVFNWE